MDNNKTTIVEIVCNIQEISDKHKEEIIVKVEETEKNIAEIVVQYGRFFVSRSLSNDNLSKLNEFNTTKV